MTKHPSRKNRSFLKEKIKKFEKFSKNHCFCHNVVVVCLLYYNHSQDSETLNRNLQPKGVIIMKKNNIKVKVMGTVMAALCAISAGAAISAVSASAATAPAAVSANVKAAKSCVMVAYGKTATGYDWDYTADSTAAKIKVTYDFKTNKYTFRATGQFAGVTNAILKYQTIDNKWHNIPVRFVTDKNLNVTGKQTAKEYITNSRY